jgi:hypothetical protein
MTDRTPASGGTRNGATNAAAWLGAISAGLSAAGLTANVNQAAGLDVTATLRRPGEKDTTVVIHEDGRAELCWWLDPAMTPAQVTTSVVRAVAVVTAIPPARARPGAQS